MLGTFVPVELVCSTGHPFEWLGDPQDAVCDVCQAPAAGLARD